MCFRWNTSINFLFWGFETTPSWSHFKVLLCKLIWDGYTHRFLLPLFLLFFLTLFDLWSRFVFLNSASPSLSSSVGYLFCLMMLSISGLYAGISCRRLQGLLSHLLCRSQSFQKCWTVHTIVDDDEKFRNVYISNLSFPKKKNYQSSPTFCRLLVATILLFPAVFWRFCSRSTSIWKPCSSSMSIWVASEG